MFVHTHFDGRGHDVDELESSYFFYGFSYYHPNGGLLEDYSTQNKVHNRSIYLLVTSTFALCILAYEALSGVATAPHNYLHLKYVSPERSSIDIACYQTISQVGEVLGVLLPGLIYDSFGIEGCIFSASLLLFGSAYLRLSLGTKYKK